MFSVGDGVYTLGLVSDFGGEHLDPPTGEILVTTDAQAAGTYHCMITITACELDDSKALFDIQHRNADDDENALIENVIVAVPVDQSWQFEYGFTLEEGERITVVPYVQGFNGRVMAAINWQRVA